MYISRKRKNAYTTSTPNRSEVDPAYTTVTADKSDEDNAYTPLSPDKSDENNAYTPFTPNKSDENNAYTPFSPDKSDEDNTYTTLPTNKSDVDNAYTPFTPNNSEADERSFPEASVELINGDDSDLGRAPSTAELTYEEFLAANPQTGALRVQAYIGAQGFPVAGALVTVSAPFLDGERVLYAVKTDADGIADNLILPAPEREASQIPGSQNPFAEYNVSVSHPDYRTAVFSGVPVFAGVKSIQPVVFLPRGTEE
ncbi:MAG: hypothetical protein IJF74_00455 [Clostridia bacterium]|nr:hypothetical protein [Clostridia bacterium]